MVKASSSLLITPEIERTIRALFAQTPVGIFFSDRHGNNVSVNDYWCWLTRLTSKQARGKGWLRSLHLDDRATIESEWNTSVKKQTSSQAEFRFVRPGGAIIWVRGHSVPWQDEAGNLLGFMGTVVDITDAKKNAERLQHLAAIVQSSDDAIIGTDLNETVISWNKGAERLFGYREREMIGKPVLSLNPKDRINEESSILKRVRRGNSINHFETVRHRKDGHQVEISLTISPVKNLNGQILGAAQIARDITVRKQAESQQKTLYELLARINQSRKLVEIQKAAIKAIISIQRADRASLLLFDDAGIMRFKAWKNLSAAYRHAAEGHSPWTRDVTCPTPVFISDIVMVKGLDEKLKTAIAKEGIGSLAFIPITFDQKLLGKFMIYYDAPHEFTEEEIVPAQTIAIHVGFAIQRAWGEKQLRQARDEAERANHAKDNFLAILSHELRIPLNPALLLASAGATDPQLPRAIRNNFEAIRRGVELGARLIDDLLDLARFRHNRLMLDRREVNLSEIIKEAWKVVKDDSDSKRISLDLICSKDCFVRGDPVRLQQIFWNLLKNAVKFTPHGGRITIMQHVTPRHVTVKVCDNGIGMSAEEISRIFGAFSQGDHAAKTGGSKFGGLGLGLSITKVLVEKHGGKIKATSKGLNKGSTFIIELPRIRDKNQKRNGRDLSHPLRATSRTIEGKRILLVEDHEATRLALSQLLRNRHHTVTAVGSVAEAKATTATHQFDLLISDLGLPDGDGCDLMLDLKEKYELTGIALTGHGMEEDIVRIKKAGFANYLVKPVQMQILEETMAQSLFLGKNMAVED